MSQDAACSGIEFQKTDIVSETIAEQKSCGSHGKYALQDIPQQCQRSCLFSHSPEGISRTSIPAAVLPDINSLFSSVNIGCLEKP